MSTVLYDLHEHIATLTINRPEALNALNSAVLADFEDALAQILADEPRVVLVTGAGSKAFVAGGDISEMATMTPAEAQHFSERGNGLLRALETLPAPTIAVVGGFALGGGCELALACDIRLASSKAKFGQPEVGLGIIPGFGGTQRLSRVVGPSIAKEMIFGAQFIDAARALAIGLVSAVYEPDELMPAAVKLAATIASKAPVAVRLAKTAIDQGADTDIPAGLVIEAAHFAACFETNDQSEAMAAFVEKRSPAPFQGN